MRHDVTCQRLMGSLVNRRRTVFAGGAVTVGLTALTCLLVLPGMRG